MEASQRPAGGHADGGGGPCANCGTVPVGPWCHACGQQGGPAHGSIRHLAAELAEAMTHADSRLWRTLRRLLRDPARLSGDYLAGRRAAQIPPLRLFLVMLFVVFSFGSFHAGHVDLRVGNGGGRQTLDRQLDGLHVPGSLAATLWLRRHVARSVERPDEVLSVMQEWAERFTLLMLPVAAVLLWILYLPLGRFTLYDHMIVSMHSLCFACLALATFFVLRPAIGGIADGLLLLPPVHLFAHLRGTYGGGVVATLLRMAVLGIVSVVAAAMLLLGLTGLGLELGARG